MIGPPLPIAAANNWQIKQRQKTQACKPQSYHSQNYWRTFDVFVLVWQWASHSLSLRCFMSLAPGSWWNAGLSLNLARCGEHLHCANTAGTQLDSTMTQSYSFPSSSIQVKQSFLMFSSVNDTREVLRQHFATWKPGQNQQKNGSKIQLIPHANDQRILWKNSSLQNYRMHLPFLSSYLTFVCCPC